MRPIKLFHPETYPDAVTEIRKKLQLFPDNIKNDLIATKYLSDYTSVAMWNIDEAYGKLHNELIIVLEPYDIVAYHNTRLPDTRSIESQGLIFSDDRYMNMLQATLQSANITYSLINEVMGVVVHERDRWKSSDRNRRKNEVCFIYDMDYYKNYDKFLAVYGGEFMEFGLSTHTGNKSLSKYRNVIKIGHPYVVEFSIPFSWIHPYDRQDVARYMMEEWIHLDIRNDDTAHQYDGRIEHEIPANKIIKVHEVEDSFSVMDEWMFREN